MNRSAHPRKPRLTSGKEPRDHMRSLNVYSPAVQAALAVAALLEVPRDRLGRPDFAASDEARAARDAVRSLALEYGVPGAQDSLEQAAMVLRAALKKEGV